MDYLGIRLLCAFFSGMLLSQSGTFIQLGTRNILASPSTLGVDGLAILWLVSFHSLTLIIGDLSPLVGILSGLPFFVLITLSFTGVLKNNKERVILLGLTFNLLVGAIFSLWQFFFIAYNLPFPMEVWFGHFRYAESSALWVLVLTEALILTGVHFLNREIKLYSLGPQLAQNFELREKKFYLLLFGASILSTYVVVNLFGAFAFLGLIGPIISRRLWFSRFDLKGEVLIGSAFNGAILMLIDYLCFELPIYGAEVPVGLLMTVIGAVSLILLVWLTKGPSQLLANSQK